VRLFRARRGVYQSFTAIEVLYSNDTVCCRQLWSRTRLALYFYDGMSYIAHDTSQRVDGMSFGTSKRTVPQ